METDKSKNSQLSPGKKNFTQWGIVILVGLLLYGIRGVVNHTLGFKHSGGGLLTGLSTCAIFSICTAIFYSPLFKSNKNQVKKVPYKQWSIGAFILLSITIWIYISLFENKISFNNPPIISQEQYLISETDSDKTDHNDEQYIDIFVKTPDLDSVKRACFTENVKIDKFWASQSNENKYFLHTASIDTDTNILAVLFIILDENKRLNFTLLIKYQTNYQQNTDGIGHISIGNTHIPINYSYNSSDGFLEIDIYAFKIHPLEIINLMKKGDMMDVNLELLNIYTTFSLQGFTAAGRRIKLFK